MDEQQFKDTVERLKQVDTVIGKLDPAIRSEAFGVLRPYVEGEAPPRRKQSANDDGDNKGGGDVDTSNLEAFVRSQELEKPSDAVYAISAWWFGQYGSAPLTTQKMQEIADEIGVTLPARPDMTLAQATADNKALFRKAGRGQWVPTQPHGELYFKDEYGVSKGRKNPPGSDGS